jgi:hypothetical protein
MIRNEELQKLRKLTEAFADVDNHDYADTDNTYLETNRSIKDICKSLVDSPAANDEQEAELCYILLLATNSIIIINDFPFIDKVVARSEQIVSRLKPSLRQAQLYTYLYSLESEDEYKEKAKAIIATWKGRETTDEERQLIKNFELIAE